MFSLQKLLGQEDKFFTLLESSAMQSKTAVEALKRLIAQTDRAALSDEFVVARKRERQLRGQIAEAVYSTFVTAIEREDIESLANALYRIPKTVEKFGIHLVLAPQHVRDVDFSRQILLLEGATDTVAAMVRSLRKGVDGADTRQLNEKMQQLESDADRVIHELLRELFNQKMEPAALVVRKDLYELLEKIIDRCRDVGNLIAHIVLKNS